MKRFATRGLWAAGLLAAAALLAAPNAAAQQVQVRASSYLVGQPGQPERPPLPKTAATSNVQEVVFFTADGPVRVRVTVMLAGTPVPTAWRSAVDGLFTYADTNRDGRLTEPERGNFQFGRPAGNPYAQALIIDGPAAGVERGGLRPVSFADKDGKVSRDAFRAGLVDGDLGPLTVTPVKARADSPALSDALFKQLDVDGDGKLSVAELTAARPRLAALDVDEDETLTTDELLGRSQTNPYQYALALNAADSATPGGPRPPRLRDVLILPVGQPVTPKAVLAERDRNKDGALTAAELGCDAAALAKLDTNADGRLSGEEVAGWLARQPDVDLTADLADPPAGWLRPLVTAERPPLTLSGTTGLGAGAAAAAGRAGECGLALPRARLRFAADAEAGESARATWAAAARQARAVFDKHAKGKNVLDLGMQELGEDGEYQTAAAVFNALTKKDEGKVTRAELERFLAAAGRLVNCRAEVTVTDQGRGLFELLDRDGDGQLSAREQAGAADAAAGLDRNGDGKLERAELPRGYSVSVAAGSVDVTGNQNNLALEQLVLADGTLRRPVVRKTVDAPEWFRNADRNGDGDVSATEFAGPPALFRRIDADGDGLLSPAEARAYEAKKGK